MLRTFVNGKIHQLKVTGFQPGYNGSCLICPDLLAAAGIEPFEKVEIYSLTSTARIATYVFPGAAEGEFTLNGSAALHFRLGDLILSAAKGFASDVRQGAYPPDAAARHDRGAAQGPAEPSPVSPGSRREEMLGVPTS